MLDTVLDMLCTGPEPHLFSTCSQLLIRSTYTYCPHEDQNYLLHLAYCLIFSLRLLSPYSRRGTGSHPLLKIHLESHTALFQKLRALAMIYLASEARSVDFEPAHTPRVVFEAGQIFSMDTYLSLLCSNLYETYQCRPQG